MTTRKADVVVIGGSAAGLTAAITARRHYPDASILVVRREKQVLIPCGIPYIFGTVGSPEKNLIPDTLLEKNRLDLLVSRATGMDRKNKVLTTDDGEIAYQRLVVATGSLPAMPPVPGFDREGVYAILKDVDFLRAMQERIRTARNVVVIGGGFIGVEFADEINKLGGKTVTIVEILPHCLSLAYDDEFCLSAEKLLGERGVHLRTGCKVKEVAGAGRAERVVLEDGSELPADAVILGIGAVADVELARKAGLEVGLSGAIAVDRTMRTSDPDIFACGDCAEKVSFFGGGRSPLKLASIATLEARIAGANLFGLRRENPGTVGAWSTAIGPLALGTAGLTEAMASRRGYQIVSASVEGPNRHPGCMPGAAQIKVKLVFEKHSGVLLGGQAAGDAAAGEVINLIAACVQTRMTAEQMATFQMGTHPALTASPIAYTLVNAAEMAIARMH
jgi:NADPH-dependent 2,4-dienoyl-CoA reductase/sulfur reductase-like enzyme